MIIAIDFDGTLVRHKYPSIGIEVPGAVITCQQLANAGHKLILWTMRSGVELQEAVDWCNGKQIPLYGVNRNPSQLVWTTSPKAYAQTYIDDSALGVPLKRDGEDVFVDWELVRGYLLATGYLTSTK